MHTKVYKKTTLLSNVETLTPCIDKNTHVFIHSERVGRRPTIFIALIWTRIDCLTSFPGVLLSRRNAWNSMLQMSVIGGSGVGTFRYMGLARGQRKRGTSDRGISVSVNCLGYCYDKCFVKTPFKFSMTLVFLFLPCICL